MSHKFGSTQYCSLTLSKKTWIIYHTIFFMFLKSMFIFLCKMVIFNHLKIYKIIIFNFRKFALLYCSSAWLMLSLKLFCRNGGAHQNQVAPLLKRNPWPNDRWVWSYIVLNHCIYQPLCSLFAACRPTDWLFCINCDLVQRMRKRMMTMMMMTKRRNLMTDHPPMTTATMMMTTMMM